jgi:ferredoxin-NADP reductase
LGSCKGGRLITFALAVRTASEHPYDAYLKQVVGKNANVEYRCFYLSIKDVERGGAEQDGHERQVELEGRMDLERIKDVVYLNDAQTQYL